MPDTFRATLLQLIKSLERQLAAARATLQAYDSQPGKIETAPLPDVSGPPSTARFRGMRPYDAIVRVLSEHGGAMDRDDLLRELADGGATEGKKRGMHNLRISIEVNESLGKLAVDGSRVALPDFRPSSPQ